MLHSKKRLHRNLSRFKHTWKASPPPRPPDWGTKASSPNRDSQGGGSAGACPRSRSCCSLGGGPGESPQSSSQKGKTESTQYALLLPSSVELVWDLPTEERQPTGRKWADNLCPCPPGTTVLPPGQEKAFVMNCALPGGPNNYSRRVSPQENVTGWGPNAVLSPWQWEACICQTATLCKLTVTSQK